MKRQPVLSRPDKHRVLPLVHAYFCYGGVTGFRSFPHLRKQFWGRHFWARGYLAVSSGALTDEMVQQYIEEQEGEPVHDDSQFPIDSP